jgi:hypothetical protein
LLTLLCYFALLMSLPENNPALELLPPEEQLNLLEDLYAQCLFDDADAFALSQIWEKIKRLRLQLAASENSSVN